jgi:excisionase family DNA binding protein
VSNSGNWGQGQESLSQVEPTSTAGGVCVTLGEDDLATQKTDRATATETTPRKRAQLYSTRPKRPANERNGKLLTPGEAADYFGCTESQIRKLSYRDELTGVYVGGLLRFEIAELDAYIERNRIKRGSDA